MLSGQGVGSNLMEDTGDVFPRGGTSTPTDLWAKPQAGAASACMTPSSSQGAAGC